MAVKDSTRKTLWSRSRDQCAFPGCLQALTVDLSTNEGSPMVKAIGQEAHIRAQSIGGPRYDRDYSDVHGYDNLLLVCPTHHSIIDANNGVDYSVEELLEIKKTHEKNQQRREELDSAVRAYLGDRFVAENSVQFQQVNLRGPSVDDMFVDVPVGCRKDQSSLATLLGSIAESAPGDTELLEQQSGLIVTGATQALLHPEWSGNAVLVGGPGQGKSTVLQYVCQFHRARRLDEEGYTAGQPDLVRAKSKARFPVRVELRRYAEWASRLTQNSAISRKIKKIKQGATTANEEWRSLEKYIIEEIQKHIGAHEFNARDLALLLATEPVLLALDGLDEVASLSIRAQVVEEITRMWGRLKADAADLVILVATRPGTSLQPLTSSNAFPVLHLQKLTQGLRLQYLQQWCQVSGLSQDAAAKLQSTFMNSQHVPHVNELASYPMQLAILLHLLYRRQLLPQQRTELYEEYLKTFLDREQGEDKEPLLAEQRRVVEETHAYLGWYLQTKAEEGQSAGSITREELRALIKAYLAGRPKEQELADELYSAITDRVLCMVEREDAFEFEVQSLREYFAALHLFENLTPKGKDNSRDDGLNALIERPYWANVCRFFIGKLSRGEVKSLSSNLREVEARVAPHPMTRAMAVTVLNDRIYEGHTNAAIQEVVDLIFDGPGLVFAEDGLLDPAGTPLRLGQEAGREQAIKHLQDRVLSEPEGWARRIAARSLRAQANADADLSGWWWERFQATTEWLDTGSRLGVFSKLTANQTCQLTEALSQVTSSDEWLAHLLVDGGYDGADEGITQFIIDSLNAGGAETSDWQEPTTDASVLTGCAAKMVAGPYAHAATTNMPLDAPRSTASALIEESTLSLRQLSESDSDLDWVRYLSVLFGVWGDGWILRRAVSMVPESTDLSLLALRTSQERLAGAIQNEADYREHKADADWWRARLERANDQVDKALTILALLETARTTAIITVAKTLDSVVGALDSKRFRACERALERARSSHRSRPLDLSEALRLRQISLSGRSLWFIWVIGSDSTRDRIPVHLEADLEDALSAGPEDGYAVVRAATSKRKINLNVFAGTRESLPAGGWDEQKHLSSMTLKIAQSVLGNPGGWPADVVQIAVDKIGSRAANRTPPLSEVASTYRWFLND